MVVTTRGASAGAFGHGLRNWFPDRSCGHNCTVMTNTHGLRLEATSPDCASLLHLVWFDFAQTLVTEAFLTMVNSSVWSVRGSETSHKNALFCRV